MRLAREVAVPALDRSGVGQRAEAGLYDCWRAAPAAVKPRIGARVRRWRSRPAARRSRRARGDPAGPAVERRPHSAALGYRASCTTLPPATVRTTVVLAMASAGAVAVVTSCDSTMRSATLPGSIDPSVVSSRPAYAASIV